MVLGYLFSNLSLRMVLDCFLPSPAHLNSELLNASGATDNIINNFIVNIKVKRYIFFFENLLIKFIIKIQWGEACENPPPPPPLPPTFKVKKYLNV